ncbi:MAG: hypothetical protein E7812_00345 [Phenylobacterium sp.]|nr:MAG: hypothetical protein E7812_00345 [Phenylobacterium sp.]
MANLIDMANEHGIEVGVTLTVGGSIVSGTIISGVRYFEEFGQLFATGLNDPEVAAQTATAFAGWGQIYQTPEGVDAGTFRRPAPTYIHLRDARFFGVGQTPIPATNGPGFLWRGKISAVDGFSLGSLSPTPGRTSVSTLRA